MSSRFTNTSKPLLYETTFTTPSQCTYNSTSMLWNTMLRYCIGYYAATPVSKIFPQFSLLLFLKHSVQNVGHVWEVLSVQHTLVGVTSNTNYIWLLMCLYWPTKQYLFLAIINLLCLHLRCVYRSITGKTGSFPNSAWWSASCFIGTYISGNWQEAYCQQCFLQGFLPLIHMNVWYAMGRNDSAWHLHESVPAHWCCISRTCRHPLLSTKSGCTVWLL